jgi:hypothetical protein
MTDMLGYTASLAVLATFLMRTMVPLRLVAILSNVLFLGFGYIQDIHPVFVLHLALLPINVWRLFVRQDGASVQTFLSSAASASYVALRSHTFWFVIGLLAGLGSLVAVLIVDVSAGSTVRAGGCVDGITCAPAEQTARASSALAIAPVVLGRPLRFAVDRTPR